MCGIAGILGRVNDRNHAALRAMADAIAHRGPDSGGFWTSTADAEGNGCLFAHRRLSILDLSTAADQPMTDPVGGQTIIFNGEIYNYLQLREDLQRAGQQFTSSGDTAVMLRLLALHGPQACAQLRGMFTFAMWDPKDRTLTIARDGLGIKPIYLCKNPDPRGDWSLLFSSEVRSILASGLIGKPRLDPAAVASVIWNGFVMGPGTAIKGVESVWPGQVHVIDGRGKQTETKRFWKMPAGDVAKKRTKSEMRDALRECVKLHLASDVPLGVFLSSGVDSSAVANLAQQASDRPVNTFTLAFEEASLNEGEYAKAIAKAIGTNHSEILLTESSFVKNLETAVDTLDQPTFDGLNSYFMSKAVREAGLTVALVGTGGDELFGGYTSFRYLPTMIRWARRSGWMPRSAKVAAARLIKAIKHRSRGAVAPQTRWAKLPDMVDAGEDLLSLYQLSYALFLPDFQGELTGAALNGMRLNDGLPDAMHERLSDEMAGHSPLSAIGVLEQRCFLGERLLRDTDAASMAVALELRVPLVDAVLTEQVNALSDDDRFAPVGRKQMLRDIGLEGLDPGLFERPKTGFVLPFDRWIRSNLGRAMTEVMTDASLAESVGLNGATVARLWQAFQDDAPGMYWSRVWAIYVLIRWCHRHNVLI